MRHAQLSVISHIGFVILFCNYYYVSYSTYYVISQIHVLQKEHLAKVNLSKQDTKTLKM